MRSFTQRREEPAACRRFWHRTRSRHGDRRAQGPRSPRGPAKIDGKTVNKRLTEREARLYQEWIANDRKARSLLAQLRDVAAQAAAVIT